MTFYGFALTFRHDMYGDGSHALDYMNQFFFANQIFRDKRFPKHSHDYAELKNYVSKNYREDIVEGFDNIWIKFKNAEAYQ